jgi:predicted transcriptional regulator
MIFPEFGRLIMTLLYWGCGMFAWLGFHQVTRKTSLNHPIRDQIMCFVRSHPGCHFRSIMRENGINRGTLSYHLDRLTSFGLMREVKDGGLTRYFVHTNEVSELEQKILAHRDNPRRNQILGMLNSDKSTPKTALTNHLKISGPALCYHMQILMGDEIVLEEQDRQKVGRPVRYSLTQNAAKILKNNSKGAQTRAEFNDISTNVPDGNLQTGTDTGVRV